MVRLGRLSLYFGKPIAPVRFQIGIVDDRSVRSLYGLSFRWWFVGLMVLQKMEAK